MAKKTNKTLVFQKQTVAELRELIENAGCGEAKRRFDQFTANLKRAKISAKTPISAGMIMRFSGIDALQWLADNRGEPGDRATAELAENIQHEIEANIGSFVADRLDALEG